MKIILLEEVEALGLPGDVVDVARGYAQNYLIPTNQAALATKGKLHDLQKKLDAKRKKVEIFRASASELAERIASKPVYIPAKAGEAGKLYGSVTPADIAQAVNEEFGVEIDRKKLNITEPLKMLGTYMVIAKVHIGVESRIQVVVYDEQSEKPDHAAEPAEVTAEAVETVAEEAESIEADTTEALEGEQPEEVDDEQQSEEVDDEQQSAEVLDEEEAEQDEA